MIRFRQLARQRKWGVAFKRQILNNPPRLLPYQPEALPMFRHTALLAFTFVLIAAPTFADDFVRAPTFGRTECTPAFPCDQVGSRDIDREYVKQLINNANECLASQLSLRDTDGYFVESSGLDSKTCLKTKKMTKNNRGLTMTPRCCIKPTRKNADMCQIVCVQYGVQ